MGNIIGYVLAFTQENKVDTLSHEAILIEAMNQYSKKLSIKQSTSDRCFYMLSKSYIIDMIHEEQLASCKSYGMLDPTCLNMLELVCKVPFFDPEGCSQVNHLIDPLKEYFGSNDINGVHKAIQMIKKNPLTTSDYRLIDILEYMIKMCSAPKKQPFDYWLAVFDMLFRGSNVKLSRHSSKFTMSEISDTIVFHCLCQDTPLGQQKSIEIAFCCQTNDKMTETHNLLINKSILSYFLHNHDKDMYNIGIQLTENQGYFYSLKPFKNLFLASPLCHISMPNTVHELHSFLYEQHGLEILCHLKKHYTKTAKILRQTTVAISLS